MHSVRCRSEGPSVSWVRPDATEMDEDKQQEMQRYDDRALSRLSASGSDRRHDDGVLAMPAYLRAPYLLYESRIAALIGRQHTVLELGAGAGGHTLAIARTGAQVTATDISPHSLALLAQRLAGQGLAVQTRVADMEALPFAEDAFDFVACAGSLSYGDPALVDAEIRRVLRPGGCLICVDSLNHNPVYRLNRLIHCLRGNRTRSTLVRMPDLRRIEQMSRPFRTVEVRCFGALSFAMPMLARVIGPVRAGGFSDWFDRAARIRRSAFKFVLIARMLEKL